MTARAATAMVAHFLHAHPEYLILWPTPSCPQVALAAGGGYMWRGGGGGGSDDGIAGRWLAI